MPRQFKVTVNGREYDVAVLEVTPGIAPGISAAAPSSATPHAEPSPGHPSALSINAPVAAATSGDEVAQMGGVIVQIDVKVGQTVIQGDRLLVLEAMKMKTSLVASRAGQISRILVAVGDAVEGGQPLVSIK
jgi:biotin carboxyl carrier protein